MDGPEIDPGSEEPFVSELLSSALKIVKLVAEKRKVYGNSFDKVGQIMMILYPDGVPPSAYRDSLAIIRMLDKIVRLANSQGVRDPMSEDPWSDILGYALLSVASPGKEKEARHE